jgi:hypothetical protein
MASSVSNIAPSACSVNNFKRIEKLIESGNHYLPKNWEGNNDETIQEAMLDHMMMYVLKMCVPKGISKDVWYVEAKLAINEHAFWYATDIFDDLSIMHQFENLIDDIKVPAYLESKKLDEIYGLYVKYMENYPLSPFYKKIYEFVDECLCDDDTWLVD